MMVVTISVWPGGDESRSRDIERLFVWNVSNLTEVSDYEYQYNLDPQESRVVDGEVWNHRRSAGAWELVRRVLVPNAPE